MNNQGSMETEGFQRPLIIGYYPFRAKAQICRLLCEYFHVPYVDLLFTPDEWSRFKDNQAKHWVVKDLPFLIDGDFVVTGTSALFYYIAGLAGRQDIFGRTIEEKIKVDSIRCRHDLRNAILGLLCASRPDNTPEDKKCWQHYWSTKIEPILHDYENECIADNWYFGYFSIMDFLVYELLGLIQNLFLDEVHKFKKLMQLKKRFESLKEIQAYEHSERSIKEFCPVRYFNRYKEQVTKNFHESHAAQHPPSHNMEVE